MIEVPTMRKFREFVDAIPSKRDRMFIKIAYLTAARVSELTTKVTAYDLKHKKSKAYGIYSKWELSNFAVNPENKPEPERIEKVLVLTLGCAKRKVRTKGEEVITKLIALPCNPVYEPWTIDLLKHLQERGSFSFNFVRWTGWNIATKNLKPLDPKVHTHTLRHWRITHLIDNYDFEAKNLMAYAGWTAKTAFSGESTGQTDIYYHLAWKKYFSKLLIPIEDILKRES